MEFAIDVLTSISVWHCYNCLSHLFAYYWLSHAFIRKVLQSKTLANPRWDPHADWKSSFNSWLLFNYYGNWRLQLRNRRILTSFYKSRFLRYLALSCQLGVVWLHFSCCWNNIFSLETFFESIVEQGSWNKIMVSWTV